MFWIFGHKEWGILASSLGIKRAPDASEGKVLTAGPPRKSQDFLIS